MLRQSGFSRRGFLRYGAAGVMAGSISGWLDVLAARAGQPGGRPKACIVLFMSGGPAQIDTFDPKPDAPEEFRGPFGTIATAVPGIHICENFPGIARMMKHGALIRSMSTRAGEHADARYHVHSGRLRGGVEHPSLGSIVGKELGRPEFPLPSYVSVGPFETTSNDQYTFFGSGFLGPRHQPLVVKDPQRGLEHLKPQAGFDSRLGLLADLQRGFFRTYPEPLVEAQQTTVERSVRLMQCREVEALDISREADEVRETYGKHPFGDGCLLARRLVEIGVPFVEVGLGGWDVHSFTNDPPGRTKHRSQIADRAATALLEDLHQRGLLESTLVVWMGEFGRSPKRTANGGTDHWPRAWSSALFGGGIRGGQVIGKTDFQGGTVEDRVVHIQDFLATICRILDIDYTRTNEAPGGRPVRIVEEEAQPISELFA